MGRMEGRIRGDRAGGALVLASLAAFGLSACGGDEAVTEPVGGSVVSEELLADADFGSAIDVLTQSLGLDDDQREAVQELAARYTDRSDEPGAAWYAAAELQGILSGDQIAELGTGLAAARERVRAERGDRSMIRDRAGSRQRTGERSAGRMWDGGRGFAGLDLTEEQREQIQTVLESHRAELSALREELRDSGLSREEMRSRAEAVREAIRDEIEPLLTQEQLDRLQEREAKSEARRETATERPEAARAWREAEHAAMVDALELTDAQVEQLESLRQDRGAHREAFGEILTDAQREIITLHRALAVHRFRAAGAEGRGRGAGRRHGGARVHGVPTT